MLSRQYLILHIGLSVNTPTHTPPHTPRPHKPTKEKTKTKKKQDQIIECLVILIPNFINHKITSFSIQVLVHINNNQFKYYVLLIHVTQSVLTVVKY